VGSFVISQVVTQPPTAKDFVHHERQKLNCSGAYKQVGLIAMLNFLEQK
jgi:hypothetical protein